MAGNSQEVFDGTLAEEQGRLTERLPDATDSALQVYHNALVFEPQQSIVRQMFKRETPEEVQVKSELDEDWGPLLHTLKGHTDRVTSVAFSVAGDRLASASLDNVGCGSTGQTGKRQKVVVLRELQRASIYTTR